MKLDENKILVHNWINKAQHRGHIHMQRQLQDHTVSLSIINVFINKLLHTNTSAHISRWVGVALVALAAVGAVSVLAEAMIATDGLIDTLINIWGGHRGEHNIIHYNIPLLDGLPHMIGLLMTVAALLK